MIILNGDRYTLVCEYGPSHWSGCRQEAEARKLKQAAEESEELSKVAPESSQNRRKKIDPARRANLVREEQLARQAREEKEQLGSTRGVFDKEQRKIDEEAKTQMAREAQEEEEALQLMQQEAEQQARRAKEMHEEAHKLRESEQQQQRKEQEKNEQLQAVAKEQHHAKEARCSAATTTARNPFHLLL